MHTILVVSDSADSMNIPFGIKLSDVKVAHAPSVDEAATYFNGETGATILVVGCIPGAREFVQDIRKKFPLALIVGLAENRQRLLDCGCNCFTNWGQLPLTMQAFLEKALRMS